MKIILECILIFTIVGCTPNKEAVSQLSPRSPQPLRLAILDTGPGSSHERQIQESILSEVSGCKALEIRSFPIFKPDGSQKVRDVVEAIDDARNWNANIIQLAWNLPFQPATRPIIKRLNDYVKEGGTLVGAVGRKEQAIGLRKLKQTVLYQVQGLYLIGEATQGGKIKPSTLSGDGVFAILKSPNGLYGSSFSSARFSGMLASAACKSSVLKVTTQLKTWKRSQKSPYPFIQDFQAVLKHK